MHNMLLASILRCFHIKKYLISYVGLQSIVNSSQNRRATFSPWRTYVSGSFFFEGFNLHASAVQLYINLHASVLLRELTSDHLVFSLIAVPLQLQCLWPWFGWD
jgi:hypothetical protein